MSTEAGSWARRVGRVLNKGKPLRQSVLNELADHANSEGHCWPSIQRIAENTCMSYASVKRQLMHLESMGLLTRERVRRTNGTLGRYEFWLMMHQADLIEPAAKEPERTGSPGQSDQGSQGAVVTVSPTRAQSVPQPGLSVSPQEPSVEPSVEPREGARARDPVDNSQSRSIRWGTSTLNLSGAPPELSDDAVREWLQWRSDRRLPIAPLVVHQVMLELGRAQQRGWDPNEALSIWMTAGWSTFRAEYLDRMRAQTEREASSTPATAEIDTAWEAVLEVADRGGTIADVDRRVMGIVSAMGGPPALAPLNAKQRARARQDFAERYTRERQRKTAAAGG